MKKKCRLCGKNKELLEFSKNPSNKDGLRSACKKCRVIQDKEYRSKNREKVRENFNKWKHSNADKVKKYAEQYYSDNKNELSKKMKINYIKNKELILKKVNNYREQNRDKILAKKRESYKNNREEHKIRVERYRKNNLKAYREYAVTRRLIKRNAKLKGFTKETRRIYENCPKGHHVDHIIPLNNPKICGLHVPWNLQNLPAIDNIRKSNKLILKEA